MKGFTLIELLAVLVILSIILLIAFSVIPNLIEEVKKKSFEESARMIVKTGELNYAEEYLNGNFEEITFTYTNGVESSSVVGKTLDFDGKKPKNGSVIIDKDGKIAIAIHDGNFCAEKNYSTGILVVEKAAEDCTIADIGQPVPPIGEVANNLKDLDGDGFLEIWYLEQLAYIDTNATTLSYKYELMRNLDFQRNSHYLQISNKTLWTTGNGWLPIGTFTSQFDGQNNTINNLYINRSLSDEIGLFGRTQTNDSTIWVGNVRLTNVNVTGRDFVGALVGSGGNIFNSHVSGNVTGRDYVGLLNGATTSISSNTSNNCTTSGTVIGNNYVGGLSGSYGGYGAYKMSSNATVTGNNYVGGLVGRLALNLTDSYSSGSVTGNNYVGGLAGTIISGTTSKLYSLGSVNGVVTKGGLAASITGGTITNSYWNTETSGVATSAVGTGYTTAQMSERTNYITWDFFNIWGIRDDINNGYPCHQSICDFSKKATLLSLYDYGVNEELWVEGYSHMEIVQTHEIEKRADHLWSYVVGPLNQVTWVNDTPIELSKYNKLNLVTDILTSMPVGGGGVTVCFSKNKTGGYTDQCYASQKIQYTTGGTIEQRSINVLGLGLEGDYYIRFHTVGGSYMGNIATRSAFYKIWLD